MQLNDNFSKEYEKGFDKIMQDAAKSQHDRFKEAARQLEADNEARFREKLGKLVKQKPDEKKDD